MPNGGKLKGDVNARHPGRIVKRRRKSRSIFGSAADYKASWGARQNLVPSSSFKAFFLFVHIHCSSQEAIQAEYPTSTEIYGKGECLHVTRCLYLASPCPQRQTGHVQYSVAEIIAQAPFSHISISVKAAVSLSLTKDRPELIHFQWKIARELHVDWIWASVSTSAIADFCDCRLLHATAVVYSNQTMSATLSFYTLQN